MMKYDTFTSANTYGFLVLYQLLRCFAGAPDLRFVDLSYNRLTELTSDPFARVYQLEVLDVSYNQISTIHQINHLEVCSFTTVSLGILLWLNRHPEFFYPHPLIVVHEILQ